MSERFRFLVSVASLAAVLSGSALDSVALAQDSGFVPGEELFIRSRCTACHGGTPKETARLESFAAPDLSGVGARLSSYWIEKFLHRPRGLRPHGSMPNMLAGLESEERGRAAFELAGFLSSLGGPLPQEPHPVNGQAMERGRQLFHSVGCIACHKPFEDSLDLQVSLDQAAEHRREDADNLEQEGGVEPEDPLSAGGILSGMVAPVDLELPNLDSMTAVTPLAQFLLDPLAVWPSGQMPSMGLTPSEAEDIAVYLLRGQLKTDTVAAPGLGVEVFHGNFGRVPDLSNGHVVSTGHATQVKIGSLGRADHFGLRFTGEIEIPTSGEWTFFLSSDDGSLLWLDGKQVVNNWGIHGSTTKQSSVELTQGPHGLELHFFELAGGVTLKLEWRGPDQKRQEVPSSAYSFQVRALHPPPSPDLDSERVALGSIRFTSLGCGACHTTGTELDDRPIGGQGLGGGLSSLAGRAAEGCLTSADGADARWSFTTEQQASLLGLVHNLEELSSELSTQHLLDRGMSRYGCVHCHRRDGRGGVHPWNRDYFHETEEADLGDEGRLPPDLSGVGAKLLPGAMQGVLARGEGVRPYMATRMPQFGGDNVGWMGDAFGALDPDLPRSPSGLTNGKTLGIGIQLMGTIGGLGCIQCHDFAGTPSLGIRAVDLATIGERIKPGWFEALLGDPSAVNMNTRMAELFVDGKSLAPEVLGGDPGAQIRAIWQALLLGSAMPLPLGLRTPDADFELRPQDGVVTCGVFMKGLSPRTLVVGFPDLLHFAFDMQNSRLGRIWQGRFFNARGTWEGRAGSLEDPPGSLVLQLPEGMVLARMEDPKGPWPSAVGREAGFVVLGRQQALGQAPVFRYAMGGVSVEDSLRPLVRDGRRGFVRTLKLTAADQEAGSGLFLRLAAGDNLRAAAQTVWRLDCGTQDVEIRILEGADSGALDASRGDLRLPLNLQPLADPSGPWGATLSWEITW